MKPDKEVLKKQLKQISSAIDLIKISQRSQHTSIKEALRKMLRSISMLAEIDIREIDVKISRDLKAKTRKDLMKKAKEIKERREKAEKEDKDATNKTKS